MSVSTSERSAARQPNPVERDGLADLIRTIGGVHLPAAGPWEIGSGQRLGLAARGLRTRELPARVLCGTLIVADDLLGSSLDFTMLVPDTTDCIVLSTRVTGLLSLDAWRADGMTTTASGSRPASLQLRYNGVFRQRGRPPSLWLTIQATVDVPELGVAVGHRRAGRLKMAAELNLNPRVASAR
ncbi:MAG: hypothetical protein ABJA93_14040 [Sporichthyaceae bacterium]